MAKLKRPRTVQGKNTATFESAEHLIETLRSRSPEALKNALVSFRNQITVGYDERPGVGDARVILVTSWLEKSSGASELFDIWDTGSNYTSLVLVSLAHTLSLISGTPAGSTHAPAILRVLFDSTHARRLNAHLASGQTDVVLAALKVLGAAASIDPRSTFDSISWTAKALPKLLSHRHRTPTPQPLAHPSIRTALITLVLALLPLTLPLELFTALFKGIAQDEGVIVKLILEACWEKVWGDVKVSKSSKIKIFGGLGIYLQLLYDRTNPDTTDPLAPADVVHHFLLALCTKPGTGLCFRSRGWYPRPSENPFDDQGPAGKDEGTGEDDGETNAKGTVYNPLLLKLLRALRPAADARQHELAVRILNACPDLVGPYFAKGAAQLGLSLEPRLSTRWITSVGFVAAVIKAEIPVDSFYVDTPAHSSSLNRTYRADPPPLAAIIENIIPNVLTRAWLTKGLVTKPAPSGEQNSTSTSTGTLVQHTTIRLITQCLLKLSNVLEAFPPGWNERAAEVIDAVRKRVPELGVVVGITQEATKALQTTRDSMDSEVASRELLLAEGTLRLMWLYARVLPGTMAETRFDVGKLLQETEIEELGESGASGVGGLRVMCQVHMLRLLGENDQFVWSAKPPGSQHTHMYRLLALHLFTPYPPLRTASSALITRLFGTSVLFEHDPKEVAAWIESLPRHKHTTSPNAEDDITIFLAFFDDVLSRCIKTPYKYLEQGKQLYASSNDIARMPSPLLMATLEQLRHKPMEPPSRRIVALFLTRLVKLLVGKMEVRDARAVSGYMRDVFTKEGEASLGLEVISGLEAFLDDLVLVEGRMDVDGAMPTPVAIQFVKEVESMVVGGDKAAKIQATARVVDWVRSSGEGLGSLEVTRLLRSLVAWSVEEVVLRELLDGFDVTVLSSSLRALANDKEILEPLLNAISFPTAFWVTLHQSSDSSFLHAAFIKSLYRLPTELLTWACGLLAHRLDAANNASSQSDIRTCLSVLASLCQYAATTSEKDSMKQVLFAGTPIFRSLLTESAWITGKFFSGLYASNPLIMMVVDFKDIVSALLDGNNENDVALASPYSQHWSGSLLEVASTGELETNATGFSIWIPFTPASTCIRTLKPILTHIQNWDSISPAVASLLESLASHLRTITLQRVDSQQLAGTLPELLKIPKLTEFPGLLKLASTIIKHELPLGLDLSSVETSESFSELVKQATGRWSSRTGLIGTISWSNFSGWIETEDVARMSTALMYVSESARVAFAAWVEQQDNPSTRSIGPCFALVDCYSATTQEGTNKWTLQRNVVNKILDCASRVLFKCSESDERRQWAMHALFRAVQAFPENIENIVQIVAKRFPSSHKDIFHRYALSFFADGASQSYWEDVVDSVVDSALLWLVRRFAEDDIDSPDLLSCLPIFAKLLPRSSNIKPHLAEPVLVAAIKNRLESSSVMSLCSEIVVHTSLKPMSINKLLQSVLHHPSLASVCQTAPSLGDGPVRLLYSLFSKHPSSTCHPSHIIPLVHIYRGTLSRQDTQILSIFHLFEKSRQISTSEILKNWTPEPSHAQPKDFLETVCNFDSATMFRTCTTFPQRRDPQSMELGTKDARSDVYDPNFVLPLLSTLMASDEPVMSMQWIDLCRTNILSLAVSALSSKRPAMRQLGYAALVTAYTRLPDVDFQERNQLIYTLELLRNLIPRPDSTPGHPIPRLPTYTTLLLSHALRDIFSPATPLYPLISRFLLQRPEFDPKDVPLLYTLLYSSSGEWRRERGWILRFLADGMRSTEDWRVLKRRHTWDLLASLFQASPGDRMLRLSILEVLINASANKHAATSLILSSSVISWIHMQLDHTLPGEALMYLKVLDNMAVVLDHEQVEKVTSGHWRDGIAEVIVKVLPCRGEH
ncbi:ribosome 60S biogenesis amino-terminal protein [Rhizoctonia solani 123E]|uniref:Ribosome 60S biogenesis amino-terminal protein n=1 Tax=Rhizoctonia solani 123E TaxID=1423351 RepID=A0A074S5N4_9AGAM|nr:ribosome 60S biogenesis amino-terminal protein [Rhizoctonia solani 123E]